MKVWKWNTKDKKLNRNLIWKRIISDKITRIKTKHRVLSTPIQLIKKPPKSAPETEAVFHVLVLHVAALWYIFLGTIKATKEKIVGVICHAFANLY